MLNFRYLMEMVLKLFSLGCFKGAGRKQIRVGFYGYSKHLIKGGFGVGFLGAPRFKIEAAAHRENSIRETTAGIVGSSIGLYLLRGCHVSQEKIRGKNMGYCISSVPSPLGNLYINVTLLSSVK